jgi:predicted phosphodiesterase
MAKKELTAIIAETIRRYTLKASEIAAVENDSLVKPADVFPALRFPIGVVADAHANYDAMVSVMLAFGVMPNGIKPESFIFLGDSSGYGPWPVGTTQIIMNMFDVILRGNHDEAVIEYGRDKLSNGVDTLFQNPFAQMAIERHKVAYDNAANNTGLDYVEHFSEMPTIYSFGDMIFVHGSPYDHLDHYFEMLYAEQPKFIEEMLRNAEKYIIAGHTHSPMVFKHKRGNITNPDTAYYPWEDSPGELTPIMDDVSFYGQRIDMRMLPKSLIREDEQAAINFGSAGWPRDGRHMLERGGHPKQWYAKFGIITEEGFYFGRTSYNTDNTLKAMHITGSGSILLRLFERSM